MRSAWITCLVLVAFILPRIGVPASPDPDPQVINEEEVHDLTNSPVEQADVLPDLKEADKQGSKTAKVVLIAVAAVAAVVAVVRPLPRPEHS